MTTNCYVSITDKTTTDVICAKRYVYMHRPRSISNKRFDACDLENTFSKWNNDNKNPYESLVDITAVGVLCMCEVSAWKLACNLTNCVVHDISI